MKGGFDQKHITYTYEILKPKTLSESTRRTPCWGFHPQGISEPPLCLGHHPRWVHKVKGNGLLF